MFTKKKLIALAVFIAIIIGFAVKHHHAAKAIQPDAVVVNAKKVTVGDIVMQAQAVGTLSAASNIEITPQVAGQVAKVLFQDGAFVKQGTPLIQLDDAVYKAKLMSAKANLFYSQTNYHRMQLLGKQGAIAQQAIDQALADLKQKQADEQESEADLQLMLLKAPFDGVLGKSAVSAGNYVTVGENLVSLTDIQNLRVEYNVCEKFLPQLKMGQMVELSSNTYPGKKFYGKVSYISPTINADDRTIAMYADIPNLDRSLTAGLFMNVTQFLGDQQQVLLIPPEGLVPTIDGESVFKIVKGKVTSIPVTIGQRTETNVQIVKGLMPNDVIVTAGQEKLKDGMPVSIEDSTSAKTVS